MDAIILVGGQGTRLRPLTAARHKSLVPVCNRPMISYLFDWLERSGFERAVLALGQANEDLAEAFPPGPYGSMRIEHVIERQRLESGGAIRNAVQEAGIDERFLVLNGDIYIDFDFDAAVRAHEDASAELTLALTPVEDPSGFGVAVVNDHGLVTGFVEKPPRGTAPGNLVNAGAWIFERALVDEIPPGAVRVEETLFRRWSRASGTCWATGSKGRGWMIGNPERYRELNVLLARRRRVRTRERAGKRRGAFAQRDWRALYARTGRQPLELRPLGWCPRRRERAGVRFDPGGRCGRRGRGHGRRRRGRARRGDRRRGAIAARDHPGGELAKTMTETTKSPVKFGTDGWRAIIGEDFTFANVRACARATADHLAATRGTDAPAVVGFDTRFLSDEFALEAARVFAAAGFKVQLATQAAPTPAISLHIVQQKACGGIVITSSHNPFRWNGLKVKPYYGGSASPEIVADIEERVPKILAAGEPPLADADDPAIERFDPIPGYLQRMSELVDVQRIRDAGLKLAFDPMYGTGATLFAQLLGGGKTTVTEIHTDRNPLFPGIRAPEPIESNLADLLDLMRDGDYDAGIAVDGDADRVGLVDEHGTYIDQLRTFALLTQYVLGQRELRGAIVKSVTTTDMARLLAEHYGVPFFETPVGVAEHIGPLMMEHDALLGGEESGGYGFRGHLPERDGILAGLYLLDYVAATGKRPAKLLDEVFAITGPHHYRRVDLDLEPGSNDRIRATLDAAQPAVAIAARRIVSSDRTDGWRFHIPQGWLLLRLSGTEPLLRIYTEVRDESLVDPVLEAGKAIAGVKD
ncbi:MAG: sugar phosphate nucleotidyltransferase [Dehalococcoidia bacterium]|nr:sugar phosphate nucleotidyltransferase [Dehalococcoidia bacterium]